jgi:hypothetical protein
MEKKYSSVELQEWLLEKAQTAPVNVARKIILNNDQRGVSVTLIGKMYFFKYDPAGKNKLTKYDKLPMAFPIERYYNGFLGLNLHYLSVGERAALVEKLLEFKNNTEMDETTRLLVSYQLLKSMSKIETLMGPCIHRYLWSQVRSKFIEIYPSEYDKAIQLPVEDWVFKR